MISGQLFHKKTRLLGEVSELARALQLRKERLRGGQEEWGTVGLSENIIEAAWQALQDSIEYFLSHKRE